MAAAQHNVKTYISGSLGEVSDLVIQSHIVIKRVWYLPGPHPEKRTSGKRVFGGLRRRVKMETQVKLGEKRGLGDL